MICRVTSTAAAQQDLALIALDLCTTAVVWFVARHARTAARVSRPMGCRIAKTKIPRQDFTCTALDLCTIVHILYIADGAGATAGVSSPMIGGIAYARRTVIYLTLVGAFADIIFRDTAVAILGIAILARAIPRGTFPMAVGIAYAAAARQNFSRTTLDL